MVIRPILLSLLLTAPALAQVSVNPGALDHLTPSAPAPHAAAPRPPPHPTTKPRPPAHPATTHPASTPITRPTSPATHAPTAAARPRPVTIAPAPPPVAVLPPPVQAPTPPAPITPPPVPVLADAAGEATTIIGGVRITFGTGKSDLNPATAEAIRGLARAVKADPNVDLNLYSYAAGQADDPSTPRRLSLSRALTVRAMLISEGIVSTRIYPRALGATLSNGPPDRVDVTSGPPQPPPQSPPGPPPPATPK